MDLGCMQDGSGGVMDGAHSRGYGWFLGGALVGLQLGRQKICSVLTIGPRFRLGVLGGSL